MRPAHPWQDLFAFLLLLSATLVMVLVLLVTRHYYAGFSPGGRALAWLVVAFGVASLGSLGAILLRLYVQPVVANGGRRRKRIG